MYIVQKLTLSYNEINKIVGEKTAIPLPQGSNTKTEEELFITYARTGKVTTIFKQNTYPLISISL